MTNVLRSSSFLRILIVSRFVILIRQEECTSTVEAAEQNQCEDQDSNQSQDSYNGPTLETNVDPGYSSDRAPDPIAQTNTSCQTEADVKLSSFFEQVKGGYFFSPNANLCKNDSDASHDGQ